MSDPKQFIGQTIADRYRIVDVLGKGGFGTVFLVEMLSGIVEDKLAMKVLRREFCEREELRAQFIQEIRIAMRMVDKHIAQIRDVGSTEDGRIYYTMDYIPGRTLSDIVKSDGQLDPRRALQIISGILRAVVVSHKAGVVHRDLKPANVLVVERENHDEVFVLDFGIATAIDKEPSLQGYRVGTAPYMPPEQIKNRDLGFYTDVYAVGVMLYRTIGGKVPYPGRTPDEVYETMKTSNRTPIGDLAPTVRDLPGLSDLIGEALRRHPKKRLSSAQEFYDRAQQILEGRGEVASPPPPPTAPAASRPDPGPQRSAKPRARKIKRTRKGNPSVTLALAGLGILFLSLVIIELSKRQEEEKPTAASGGAQNELLDSLDRVRKPPRTPTETQTPSTPKKRGDRRRNAIASLRAVQNIADLPRTLSSSAAILSLDADSTSQELAATARRLVRIHAKGKAGASFALAKKIQSMVQTAGLESVGAFDDYLGKLEAAASTALLNGLDWTEPPDRAVLEGTVIVAGTITYDLPTQVVLSVGSSRIKLATEDSEFARKFKPKDGAHELELSVIDSTGVKVGVTRTIVQDTKPPKISLTTPESASRPYQVAIAAVDASPPIQIDVTHTASQTVLATTLASKDDGPWTPELFLPRSQRLTLRIDATDATGKKSHAELIVSSDESPLPGQRAVPRLVDDINDAIDLGARFLLSDTRSYLDYLKRKTTQQGWQERGNLALNAFALLSAGVQPDHPTIQLVFNYLDRMALNRTYATAAYIAAHDAAIARKELDLTWDRPKKPRVRARIRSTHRLRVAVEAIANSQNIHGGWRYEAGDQRDSDTSCVQFAALALAQGVQRGQRVHEKVWQRLRDYLLGVRFDGGDTTDLEVKLRAPSGEKRIESRRGVYVRGFKYKSDDAEATWNMSCAGLSTLFLVKSHLKNATKEELEAIDRASWETYAWLAKSWKLGKSYYGAYSLEKAGTLGNVVRIAGHHWYEELAAWLLSTQSDQGSWPAETLSPTSTLPSRNSTAFALLTLTRATSLVTLTRSPRWISRAGRHDLSVDPEAHNWLYVTKLDASYHVPSVVRLARLGVSPALLKVIEEIVKEYPLYARGHWVSVLHELRGQRSLNRKARSKLSGLITDATGLKRASDLEVQAWADAWRDTIRLANDNEAPSPQDLDRFLRRSAESPALRLALQRAVAKVGTEIAMNVLLDDLSHDNASIRSSAYEQLKGYFSGHSGIYEVPVFDSSASLGDRNAQIESIRYWLETARRTWLYPLREGLIPPKAPANDDTDGSSGSGGSKGPDADDTGDGSSPTTYQKAFITGYEAADIVLSPLAG
ncbi:MAG: protein kinase, partial [Planctomycetota bacterium]